MIWVVFFFNPPPCVLFVSSFSLSNIVFPCAFQAVCTGPVAFGIKDTLSSSLTGHVSRVSHRRSGVPCATQANGEVVFRLISKQTRPHRKAFGNMPPTQSENKSKSECWGWEGVGSPALASRPRKLRPSVVRVPEAPQGLSARWRLTAGALASNPPSPPAPRALPSCQAGRA